jgi:hypothetical protein
MKNSLKISALLFGIPVSWLMITTVLLCFLTYFFGHGWFFSVVAAGLLMFLTPTYLKHKRILLTSHLPLMPRVAISGLKETFFPTIDALIQSNKKVIVGLPLDRAFRSAVEYYVISQHGVIEIVDSGDPVVGSEALPETTLIVVESNQMHLEEKVAKMVERGWQRAGKPSSRILGFSRRYTQTLHFIPATS